MQDLRPNSIFLARAFMPSEEEVRAAVRAARKKRDSTPPPTKKPKLEIISMSDIEASSSDDDSDDSMPDISTMLKSSPHNGKSKSSGKKAPVKRAPAKKGKTGGGKAKAKGKKVDSDDDMESSDSDSESDTPTRGKGRGKGKATAKGRGRANTAKPTKQRQAKSRDNSEEPPAPNANLYETWKQGGSNVESSAKMMKMVEYLKEWESTGDKTIVFSQCECARLPLARCCVVLRGELLTGGTCTYYHRDVDAGSMRADLLPARDSESQVRWRDEAGSEGVLFGTIQADRRAEGYPRQVSLLCLIFIFPDADGCRIASSVVVLA